MPTVSDVLAQLNHRYGWSAPLADAFPEGSTLRALWQLPVHVASETKDPVLFEARTPVPFQLTEQLSGELVICVTTDIKHSII
jgi:hypothetical protein